MASCTDRQLAQSIREAAFSQSRAGVVRAIRPFSGPATPENLVDYINRQMFPAVQQARSALNEVYLQVADNAPSANPLVYFFSTSTVNADPTLGFLRLDASPQENATTVRVSQSNRLRADIAPWLDVMQGSATVPLGVLTLTHAKDPTRYLRFDLNSMTDQGAYWDLAVSIVESSHENPFVEGDPMLVAFIPAVSGSGTPPVPAVGILAISAGTTLASSGTVVFSNANNVSFGMNAGIVTATATVASTQGLIIFSGGASSVAASALTFANSNGVSFGLSTAASAGTLTVSHDGARSLSALALDARMTIYTDSTISGSLIRYPLLGTASNSVVSINNVLYRFHTGSSAIAGAAVQLYSASGSGLFGQALSFSNANGVSFGLTHSDVANVGRVANITASVTVASTQGSILVSAGTTSALSSSFRFSNANALAWGISTNGIITAIADSGISAVGGGPLSINAGLTGLAFTDANNVSWTLSTNAGTPGRGFILASATVGSTQGSIRISAGNTSVLSSAFTFSNSHNVSWTMNNGTLVASASFPADSILGLVSHVGGNSVTNVTRLAFSNASNVTWSLSTAAGAATVLASVGAGGGGGVALAASGVTASTGTVEFTNNTIVTGAASLASVQNVVFALTGQTMGATAMLAINDGTNSTQSNADRVSKIHFLDGGGLTWGGATGTDANGRLRVVSASYLPLAISAPGNSVSAGTVNFTNFNSTADPRGNRQVRAEMAGSQLSLYYAEPVLGGQWNGVTNGSPLALSLNHNRPYFFQPFWGPLNLFGAAGDATNAAGEWRIGHSANISNTSTASGGQSFNWTFKLALYSVVSSTGSQLTLVNSASLTVSRASGASVQSALHGSRWLVFPQTNWSDASGPLTRGNYWAALLISQNTSNDTRASYIASIQMPMGQGNVGLNLTSNGSVRMIPFAGFYTTTSGAFPGSIASSHVFTNTSASHARLIPSVSVRALNNGAFG